MGHIKFLTSAILTILFAIAIITFAINFGYDNNSSNNIAQDSDYNTLNTNLNANAEQFYLDANTSSEAMYKSTISTQIEATEGGTAFKVGPTTALSGAKNVINSAWTKIFGSGSGFSIFLTALIGILGYLSIFYIYQAWAGRNP